VNACGKLRGPEAHDRQRICRCRGFVRLQLEGLPPNSRRGPWNFAAFPRRPASRRCGRPLVSRRECKPRSFDSMRTGRHFPVRLGAMECGRSPSGRAVATVMLEGHHGHHALPGGYTTGLRLAELRMRGHAASYGQASGPHFMEVSVLCRQSRVSPMLPIGRPGDSRRNKHARERVDCRRGSFNGARRLRAGLARDGEDGGATLIECHAGSATASPP